MLLLNGINGKKKIISIEKLIYRDCYAVVRIDGITQLKAVPCEDIIWRSDNWGID